MKLHLRRDVLSLTLPFLAENSLFILMGIINTIMAGQIGKEAGAATGGVDQINVIFINFFAALSVGVTVVIAQYIGRSNRKLADETLRQGLVTIVLIATVIAILIWLFSASLLTFLYGRADPEVMQKMQVYLNITVWGYPLMAITQVTWGALRGAGDTKTPMKVNIVMNILNVLLSYVFIFGLHLGNRQFNIDIPGWGIAGAAIGITLAKGCGACIAIIVLLRGHSVVRLRNIHHFHFDRSILRSIFGIGAPSGTESLLSNMGKIITQVFIAGMGTVAMAANNYAASVVSYMNLPGNALLVAATTLVGQNMGRGHKEEAEKVFWYVFWMGTACLTFLGLISVPLAPWLAGLFSHEPEIIHLTSQIIMINGLCMVLWAGAFVVPSGLKGAGDARYTLYSTLIGMWVFRIMLGYVFGIVLGWGVIGIWASMFVDWFVRAVLYIHRLKSGRWKEKQVLRKI